MVEYRAYRPPIRAGHSGSIKFTLGEANPGRMALYWDNGSLYEVATEAQNEVELQETP